MRLSILDNGHRLRARLFLRVTGRDAPDVPRLLLYRPDFFARPLLAVTVPAMRGPSYWTAAEREYIAMRTAQLHRCPFCVDSHTELVRIAGNGEVRADDPDSARPELRAVRAFLDSTQTPSQVSRIAGDLAVSAVEDALRVDLVWNIINRLGNAFGFTLRGDQIHTGPQALHRFGYKFPGFLLSGGASDPDDPIEALRRVTAPDTAPDYAAMVRDASYKITDEDVERLKADHSEDEIFEITVAAAIEAALRSYDAGVVSLTQPHDGGDAARASR
jgi:AhpD family alkylhydroperoxidase